MAFKVFTAGAILTAAEVNDYLMEQTLIVCTAATRPSSPGEGWHIYETDTDKVYVYSGAAWVEHSRIGAWTSYTPTFANMTSAAGNFLYTVEGKKLTLSYNFTAGTATATAVTYFTLPAGMTSAAGRRQGNYDTSHALGGPYIQAADTVVYLGNGNNVTSGTSLSTSGYGHVVIEIQ